jgi:hypothetical protein
MDGRDARRAFESGTCFKAEEYDWERMVLRLGSSGISNGMEDCTTGSSVAVDEEGDRMSSCVDEVEGEANW